MAKRYCVSCGQPIAPGFKICPKCGRVPQADKPDIRMNAPAPRYSPKNGSPKGGYRQRTGNDGHQGERQRGYAPADRYTNEPRRREDDIYRERQRRAESYGRGQAAPPRGDIYAERQRRAESYGQGGYQQPRRSGEYRERQPRPEARERAYEQPQPRPAPKKQAPARKKSGKSAFSQFIDTSSKIVRIVINIIKVTVLLAVIYAGIFLIEVYRVKLTSYPYSTTMRLSKSNYGQAISGYFAEGHWSVNPFTVKCSYKGKTRHNEDMELVFSAGVKVEVSEITIDGEPIDRRLFESKIMGMFI